MTDLIAYSHEHARLPATYEAAKHALAQCSAVDECQNWADKAAALASYAKQADDETLLNYANRIKARAIRRGGALAEQMPKSPGGRPSKTSGGAPTSLQQLAAESGLSKDQLVQMIRVARVPEADFERQVESENPPTITALAEQGKKSAHLGESSPIDFRYATQALATLRRFAAFAEETDPVRVAHGVQPQEVESARRHVRAVDSWLDQFVVSLKGTN